MRNFIFILLGSLLFLSLCLIVQDKRAYYENGNYLKYLKSIHEDGDFNIINQDQGSSAWIVTESGFHPASHSEALTPFFATAKLAEAFLLSLVPNTGSIENKLGFILLNFISLFIFGVLSIKSLNLLGVQVGASDVTLFLLSCSVFYFSVFFMQVIDILAMPLIGFVIYFYLKKIHKGIEVGLKDWLLLGVVFAFLGQIKAFNLILLLPFVSFNWRKPWPLLKSVCLLLPIAFLVLLSAINRWEKFGDISFPLGQVSHYLFISSALDFILNIRDIFFSLHGMYFLNLVYTLGLIGLVLLQRHLRLPTVTVATLILFFSAYMFWPLTIVGGMSEDHFPGRIICSAVPFLFIGYTFFLSKLGSLSRIFLQVALFILHVYFTLSFFLIDRQDSYSYPKKFYLTWGEFVQSWSEISIFFNENLQYVLPASFGCVAATTLVAIVLPRLLSNGFRYSQVLLFTLFLSFVGMTLSNMTFAKKNVADMKEKGVFRGKAVATGPESYIVDYMLDIFKFLEVNSDPDRIGLDTRIASYFDALQSQIKTEDPILLEKLRTEDLTLSFWLQQNHSKLKPTK